MPLSVKNLLRPFADGRSAPRAFALLLSICLAYGGTAVTGFVSDDFGHVARAVSPERFAHARASFAGDWITSHSPVPRRYSQRLYRPLGVTLMAVEGRAFGANSAAWHAVSLLMLGIGSLLLASIATVLAGGASDPMARRAGTLAGLLFACHPAPIQIWSWVSDQAGALAVVFSLAAARAMLSPRPLFRPAAAAAFFAAALLSKETAITAPAALAALAWIRRASAPADRRALGCLRDLAPALLVLAAYFAWRAHVFGSAMPRTALTVATTSEIAGQLARSVAGALRILVAPSFADLVGSLHAAARTSFLALAAAALVLAFRRNPRRAVATAAASLAVAALLFGPFATGGVSDQGFWNARLLALPAAATSVGLALLLSLAGGASPRLGRIAVAAAVACSVAVTTLHAGSWSLAAHDLQRARERVESFIARGAPRVGMFVFDDVSGPGHAAYTNGTPRMLRPPFSDADARLSQLETAQLRVLLHLPERATLLPRPVQILMSDAGALVAPRDPWSALAARVARWTRVAWDEPLVLDLSAPAVPPGPIEMRSVGGSRFAAPSPVFAIHIAAIEISDPGNPDSLTDRRVEVAFPSARGRIVRTTRKTPLEHVALLPLDEDLEWLTSGAIGELEVRVGGRRDADDLRVALLPELPRLRLEAGPIDRDGRVVLRHTTVRHAARHRALIVIGYQTSAYVDLYLDASPPEGAMRSTSIGPRKKSDFFYDWRPASLALREGYPVRGCIEALDNQMRPIARSPFVRIAAENP